MPSPSTSTTTLEDVPSAPLPSDGLLRMPLSFTPHDPEPPSPPNRWWWALAALSVIVLIAVMIVIAQSATAPRTPWDENGIFQLARVFAGEDNVPLMATNGYYPLASIVIAPLYWFTYDPEVVYGAANLVMNAIAVATLVPLTAIGKRVGLSTPQAVFAAAVTMTMPAYAGLADYVLTEQLLGFLVTVTLWAGIRFWERPGIRAGLMLAVATMLTMFTHPRSLVLVIVIGIWLAGLLFSSTHRRHATWLLPTVLVGSYVTKLWADSLATLVSVTGDFSQGNGLFVFLSDPSIAPLLKSAFLQSWAQLVGSLGVLAFGSLVLLVWVWNEVVRAKRFGPATLIFGSTLAGAALSWIQWARTEWPSYADGPRFDTWVYTRYIAPFVIVAILLGIAALIRQLSTAMLLVTIGATTLVSLITVYVFADTVPTWGSTYGPGNVAGLRAWQFLWPTEEFAIPLTPSLTNDNRFWVIASLAVLVAQATLALTQRYPWLLGTGLLGAFGLYAYASDTDLSRDYPARIESAIDRIEAVTGEELEVISFDRECTAGANERPTTLNWIGFWLAPRDIELWRPSEGAPESQVIVTCNGWEELDEYGADDYGAIVVPDSDNYGFSVWVTEGELQDQLLDSGALTP